MAKPRVLHLITDLEPAGTEKQLLLLLPPLNQYFENHVAYLIGPGSLHAAYAEVAMSVTALRGQDWRTLGGSLPSLRLLRRLKPEVVVTYLIHADLLGRIVAKLAGVPTLVSSQRGSLLQWEWLRHIDWLTRALVTHYTVQTEVAQRTLARRLQLPAARISVVPNAVVVPPPRSTPRGQLTRLLCVSHLRRGKGHAVLLAALAEIIKRYPTTTLTLVGDGERRKALQHQAHQLGIAPAVHFVGFKAEVASYYHDADIFVLPTEAEGMSNALLEALAAGLPCVASDIPENRAVITATTTGILFPVGDHRALVEALSQLMANPAVAWQLGTAARDYVTRHHQPAVVAQQFAALLTRL